MATKPASMTFRVPQPGDPEWADYQEMLQYPAFRSSGTGSPGYALPYDPEWRAVVRGRRDAPAVAMTLANAAPSMEALARGILAALQASDGARLASAHVTRSEFLQLCWPEFPQSRPYLKIPEDEVWGMQQAKSSEATSSALRDLGGRAWTFRGVRAERRTAYRNFVLHEGVTITAANAATGALAQIRFAPVMVERDGRFKVFAYGE